MSHPALPDFDPTLDLVLERTLPVPVSRVWRAWTEPEHLKPWFCPRPWIVSHCEIDLRPGGLFRTVMNGPDGEVADGSGCYLEVVPQRRLVWTDALLPGYRPSGQAFMTGMLLLEPTPEGTRYVAIARHATPEATKQHEDMGFLHGWGAAADQLVEYVRTLT